MSKGRIKNGLIFTLIATLICCICAAFCTLGLSGGAQDMAYAEASAPASEGAKAGSNEDTPVYAGSYTLSGTDNAVKVNTWNEAITKSLDTGLPVKVTLESHWTALNGSFGADEGAGFSKSRLYVPEGADVVLDLATYNIDRGLVTANTPRQYGSVFKVEGKLTVDGTTGKITGGLNLTTSSTDAGSGINVSFGTLVLKGGNISGNGSDSTYGAVWVNYGSLDICGGNITDNKGSNYAAIYASYSPVTMSSGSITDNVTGSNLIYVTNNESSFDFTGGTISGNTVTGNYLFYVSGGAIFTMSGGNITGNTVVNYLIQVNGVNSAFYMQGGNITNNTLTGNYLFYIESRALFEMSSGKISDNTVNNYLFYINSYVKARMTGGEIANNTGNGYGFYVVGYSELRIENGSIHDNTNNNANGMVYVDSSDLYVYGGGIYNNVNNYQNNSNGGGINLNSNSILHLSGSPEIYGNTAKNSSGAAVERNVLLRQSTSYISVESKLSVTHKIGIFTTISNKQITAGFSSSGNGSDALQYFKQEEGGLALANSSGELVTGSPSTIITGSVYDDWYDTVMTSISTGKEQTFTVPSSGWTAPSSAGFNSVISRTNRPFYNGALCIPTGANIRLVLNGNLSRNLTAATGNGYVIYVSGGTLTIEGTGSITGGYNTGSGGGIYMSSGTLNINGGKITGNKANSYGGGIYYSGGYINMTGGEISGNRSGAAYSNGINGTSLYGGGGVYVGGSSFRVNGAPKITGNYIGSSGSTANNVYLLDSRRIFLTGALSSGASIGVTRGSVYGQVTTGWTTYNSGSSVTSYFSTDRGSSYPLTTTNNEVWVRQPTSTSSNANKWAKAIFDSIATGTQQSVTISSWTASSDSQFTTSFGMGWDSYGAFYNGALCVPSGANVKVTLTGNLNRGLSSSNVVSSGYVLYVNGGTLEITGAYQITGGNNASSGGGIYVTGSGATLSLTNVTVTGNKCTYSGGGIYVGNGTLNMTNVSVTNNYANQHGGGIYYDNGTVNMTGGSITGNRCYYNATTGTSYHGGGIYVDYANFNIGGTVNISSNYRYTSGTSSADRSNAWCKYPINITSKLTSSTIYVSAPSNSQITKGYYSNVSTSTSVSQFTVDYSSYGSLSVQSTIRELQLGTLSGVSTDSWTQTVMRSVGASSAVTYTLSANWTASEDGTYGTAFGTESNTARGYYQGAINIPANANIIIDLNGYTINRNLKYGMSNGYVIYVNTGAKVTIKDSKGTGKITGGYNTSNGGGIYFFGSSLTLQSGIITGNKANIGAGVYFGSTGGVFNMTGGEISGNTASNGSGNGLGSGYGGGVYFSAGSNGQFTMSGNAAVTGNSAQQYGGGVCFSSGTLNIGGAAHISENKLVSGANSNVYLSGSATTNYKINITSAITSGKKIGITAYNNGIPFTTNYGSRVSSTDPYALFTPEDGSTLVMSGNEVMVAADKWNEAVKASQANPSVVTKFVLEEDWIATNGMFGVGVGYSSGAIYVTTNINIELDLAGHTIDRGLTEGRSGGFVIIVSGTDAKLKIVDSVGGGKITGGWNTSTTSAGGIYVGGTNASLEIAGGDITGNRGVMAGGVYVSSSQGIKFTMSGGSITDNHASSGAGGVYTPNLSTSPYGNEIMFEMSGGEISGNTGKYGGVYSMAQDYRVSGTARIVNNLNKNGEKSNLYLEDGNLIKVVAPMEKGAKIGVYFTSPDGLGTITEGYEGHNGTTAPSRYFSADIRGLGVGFEGGEAYILDDVWLAGILEAVDAVAEDPDAVVLITMVTDLEATGAEFGGDENAYKDGMMYVKEGLNIILDLNGFRIDRGMTSAADNGHVFYVEGNLTIIDSQEGGGEAGSITGGWASANGGGIYVATGAKLTLVGGSVTGNKAEGLGGGIYFEDAGALTIASSATDPEGTAHTGAVVVADNYAGDKLNNLYVAANQKVIINGTLDKGSAIGVTYAADENGAGTPFTTGFAFGTANEEKPFWYFTSDAGYAVAVSGTEAAIYNDKWLAAVQQSVKFVKEVTFNLDAGWTAQQGKFASASNDIDTAYTNDGALLVPEGADVKFVMADGVILNRGRSGLAAGVGGGVFEVYGKLNVVGGTVTGGNTANNGGGILVDGGELILENTILTNNKSALLGGGVYAKDGKVTLTGATVSVNTAETGGGLYLVGETGSGAFGGNSVITENKAANGAGAYVASGALTVAEATLGKNEATANGGGLYIADGAVTFTGATVSENKAASGAGAYVAGGKIEANGADVFASNEASENGGGLYVAAGAEAVLGGTTFNENSAVADGGAIYVEKSADSAVPNGVVTAEDVTLNNNTAANGAGMFIAGVATVTGGTFTANKAGEKGGAFYLDGGELSLVGAVSVKENTAVSFGGGAYIDSDGFTVEGGVVITDNKVGENKNNVYLANKNVINLSGKVEGASISVTMEATGTFTGGWNDYYDLEADSPADYFISDMGMTIAIKDGETEVRMGVIRPTWIVSDGSETTYPYTINTPYNGKDYTQYATVPVAGVEKWEYSATIGNNYGRSDENIWVGGRAAADYVITFTLAKDYGWFDYDGNTFQLIWTIDAVVVDVEWTFGNEWNIDTETPDGHIREYDGNGYPLTVKVSSTSGDVSIDESEYEIRYSKVGSSADSSLTAPREAGSYYAYVNIKTNTNFRVESTSQAGFKITPRVLTLTWYDEEGRPADSNTSVTYQYAAAPHIVTAELAAKVASAGILDGDTVNAVIEYYSESSRVNTVREVGIYRAVSTTLDNPNYVLDVEYECIVNVIAYKLTLEWINETSGSWQGSGDSYVWEYNGRAVNLSVDAELFEGDTLEGIGLGTVSYELLGEGDESTLVATPTDIGRYKATVAVAGEHKNYDIQNAVMYFEITPKTVIVSWKWASPDDNELSEVKENGNIMLRYDGTSNHIPNAYIHDDNVLNVFYNGSLLNKLNIKVVDENGNPVDPMGTVVETRKVYAMLAQDDAANYPSSFYENFVIDVETGNRVFEIGRFVIPDDAIIWTDANGDSYTYNTATGTYDLPQYKWGTVSGTAGPGFSAHAEVSLGIVGYNFDHTANRYEDANGNVVTEENYGKLWPVDQNRGYKAVIKLTEEEYKLFEFSNGTDEASIIFYILSVTAEKEEITVIWLVKYNNTYYYIDESGALVEFSGTVADNSIPDAGKVEVADGKFAFTYNGAAQSPVAVYDKDGEYALLDMVEGTRATDVGNYKASLKASNIFEYNDGGMECEYSIKALEVSIEWAGNTAESHLLGKFEWTYDGKEHKPSATAVSAVSGIDFTVPASSVSVNSAINAGTHTAKATLSDNFAIVANETQEYVINKLKLGDGTVRWSATDMKSDTPANPRDDYFWWYFDGNEHLPTPTASFTMLDGTTVTLDLVVSGATKQVGTHYAYAVLDSTKLINNNFELGESRCTFIIHRILITNVTWTNSEEDGDDVTVEIGGAELLAFIYDGNEQAPRAYYLGDDGSRVYLDVSGAMTDVNVYTARVVSNELDFADGLETECRYAIVPRPVEITWSGDENLVYNGQEHVLTVSFTGEADGQTLVSGTDYTVTGFTDAGTHKAIITFLNGNYTYKDTNFHEFTIDKYDLGDIVEWTAEQEADDKLTVDGENISWQYNAKAHSPVLKDIGTQTDDDKLFINGITFTFAYTGAASAVGVHTARATLLSAVAGGVDVTDNFRLATTKQFNITEYVIEVLWSGNDDVNDENYGKLVWTYDGNEHAPTASYIDWTGATVSFNEVNGARTEVGPSYVASVQAPLNCVFSTEAGKGGEITFVINKAPLTVVWKYENNGAEIADGTDAEWVYDGNEHAPEAYVDGEKLVVMGARTEAGIGYVASTTYGNPNYELTNDRIQFNITARKVYIKWIGNPENAGDETNEFTWVYPAGADKFVSPTAVLVDENGDEILGSDSEAIQVTVRGAANSVGSFVAYAIDTFNNYDFADDNGTWQVFKVIARLLQANDLQWIDNGAVSDESGYDEALKAYVFTYVYNGRPQFPDIKVDDESFTYRIVSVTNTATSETSANNELPSVPGTWEVKFAPANNNYELPDEYAVTRIIILRKTVDVSWSEEKLVYNGSNQRPDAWFEDVEGKTVILDVTVDKSAYSAAGDYVATAALTSDYYELGEETKTNKYTIARKQIGLVWDDTKTSWVYDGLGHVVDRTATMSDVIKGDLSNVKIEYKITGGNAPAVVNGTVKNVGTYTVEAYLSGTAKDNYEIDKPRQEFTITPAPLTVKANDITSGVEYGDRAPVYSATFTGFVDGEDEESLRLVVGGAPRGGWITSSYTSTSLPGEYDIVINKTTLAALLTNYEITVGENGLLIVNSKDAYVIWVGQDNTKDFVYDGTEHRPTAYCYINGNKVDLTVKYASYANGVYTEITEADYKAVNAGEYYAIAMGNTAGAVLQNAQTGYSILQRQVVVNIGGTDGSVYTSVYGEAIKEITYNYAESPLPADIDKFIIDFDINFVRDDGNFVIVNTDGYTITGKWSAANSDDQAILSNNYTVSFVGERENAAGNNALGIYYVTEATIKITNEKYSPDGEKYYDDVHAYDPMNTSFMISLDSKNSDNTTYKNISYSGYQGAEVSIYYGYVGSPEDAIAPEDDTTYRLNNSPRLVNEGEYVINYMITIANHVTKYGSWTVLITPASDIVAVEFTKALEVDFGDGVPENLLDVLLGNYTAASGAGMIIGEYITVYRVTAADFIANATAKVVYNGNEIDAKTGVGKYDIIIELARVSENVDREVQYHADVAGEDTNLGKYVITPRLLTVDWGEMKFDYEEGVTHLPTPVISGWVNAEPFALEGIQTSADGSIVYTTLGVTDLDTEISVKVGANNDFTSVGGHNLTVTVESANYRIESDNAYGTYSITGTVEVPGGDLPPVVVEGNGVPDWMMYTILGGVGLLVLLVIIAMFVRRGVTVMGDADGFGEYYKEENENEQDED